MRYWTIKGDPDDRRFCFTTEPRFECPHESITYSVTDLAGGAPTITKRRPEEAVGITFTRHVSEEMAQAAQLLGLDGKKLAAMLVGAHRSKPPTRERVDGKLTNRCATCGAKMIDHGYSAYVERPRREDEMDAMHRTSAAISSRLGGEGPMVRLKSATGLKRSEARQWAWEARQQVAAELEEMSGAPSRSGHSKGKA